MPVHPQAASFGGVADAYERGRPDFPTVVVDHVIGELDLRPGRRLLDLAAGTGKLTRDLVRSGVDTVAVEPSAGMREVFTGILPRVPVLDGTAEAIPLEDDSVDAVTIAQAFHWFDPVAAFAELDRVLRPGGRIALVWNVRDDQDPLQRRCTAILERHRDGTPGHRELDLDAAVAASPFRRCDRFALDWATDVDAATFLDRFLSVSFVASLGAATRATVREELQQLFDDHAVGDRVDLAHTAQVHVLERRRS